MNVGIIGAGSIAGTLSQTMAKMNDVNLYAVASRSIDKAKAFAKEFGAKKAYSDYESLCCDPDVDLIYIATPHSFHAQSPEYLYKQLENLSC